MPVWNFVQNVFDAELILISIAVIAGVYAAKGANRLKTPQVVGYVVLGVILGPTLLGNWGLGIEDAGRFDLISQVALAVIGFTIGGELQYRALKQLGKPIACIVFAEAFGAFVLVTLGSYLFLGSWPKAILLGALSSATAPAGTVDVLQEYRAKGPLTTTLYAVVGLDDAISLVIYGFALPLAVVLLEPQQGFSLHTTILGPVTEIGLSVLVGAVVGGALALLLSYVRNSAEALGLTIGGILLCCGIAHSVGEHTSMPMSLVLSNLVPGPVLPDRTPAPGRRAKAALDGFSPPLFTIFFVLVGARLDLTPHMLVVLGPVAIAYIALRTGGKISGCLLGGTIGKAQRYVKRYVGLGLLSQAGVAIGLAMNVSTRMDKMGHENIGNFIISVITVTTLVVQILGPPFLRYILVKTGEGKVPEARGAT